MRKATVWLIVAVFSAIALGCGAKVAEKGQYTVLAQKDRFLVGVWDSPTVEGAVEVIKPILDSVQSRPPSKPVEESPKPLDLLPKDGEVPWWNVYEGTVKRYVGGDLFKYIDGAAELYHSYDFVEVATAEYINPKLAADSLIVIDIYDMGTPENAFGIYSQVRYPFANFIRVGNEAIFAEEMIDMWKGRFYIKIQSFELADQIKDAMMRFARLIDKKIREPGDLPLIVKSLPEAGKVKGSEQYFRRQLALNNIKFVSDENVLKLGDDTEGVVAKYRVGEEVEVRAFAIAYPTPEKAREAFDSYSSFLEKGGYKRVKVEAIGERSAAFNAPKTETEDR